MAIALDEFYNSVIESIISLNNTQKSIGMLTEPKYDFAGFLLPKFPITVCKESKADIDNGIKRIRDKPVVVSLERGSNAGYFTIGLKFSLDTSYLIEYAVSCLQLYMAPYWVEAYAKDTIDFQGLSAVNVSSPFELNDELQKFDKLPFRIDINDTTQYSLIEISIDPQTNKAKFFTYGPVESIFNIDSLESKVRLFIKDEDDVKQTYETFKVNASTRLIDSISTVYSKTKKYPSMIDSMVLSTFNYKNISNLTEWTDADISYSWSYFHENFLKH